MPHHLSLATGNVPPSHTATVYQFPAPVLEPEPVPSFNVFQSDQAGMVGIDAVVPLRVLVLLMRLLQSEGVVPAIGGAPLSLD